MLGYQYSLDLWQVIFQGVYLKYMQWSAYVVVVK